MQRKVTPFPLFEDDQAKESPLVSRNE